LSDPGGALMSADQARQRNACEGPELDKQGGGSPAFRCRRAEVEAAGTVTRQKEIARDRVRMPARIRAAHGGAARIRRGPAAEAGLAEISTAQKGSSRRPGVSASWNSHFLISAASTREDQRILRRGLPTERRSRRKAAAGPLRTREAPASSRQESCLTNAAD